MSGLDVVEDTFILLHWVKGLGWQSKETAQRKLKVSVCEASTCFKRVRGVQVKPKAAIETTQSKEQVLKPPSNVSTT